MFVPIPKQYKSTKDPTTKWRKTTLVRDRLSERQPQNMKPTFLFPF